MHHQIGYQQALVICKERGCYLPPKPSKNYLAQLVSTDKQAIPLDMVRYMSAKALSQQFLNSKDIYSAMCTDAGFCKFIPEEFSENMRDYVLEILNSFTGGELEQLTNQLTLWLIAYQKELTDANRKSFVKTIIPTSEEEAVKFAVERQLHEANPRFARQDKLKGLNQPPGSKAHMTAKMTPLIALTPKSSKAEIEKRISEAYPIGKRVLVNPKMISADYTEGFFNITIDVRRVTTLVPTFNPAVLPYLAYLPKDDPFVKSYLQTSVSTHVSHRIHFEMMCDPRVRQKVAFRAATNPRVLQIDEPAECSSKINPVYEQKYKQAFAQFRKAKLLMEDKEAENQALKDMVTAYKAGQQPVDLMVNMYPSSVRFEDFNWDGKNLTCPLCWAKKVNKTFAVYACFHIVCDTCLRRWDSDRCPMCNLPRPIIRDGEPSPSSSEGDVASDEEEEEKLMTLTK